MRVMIDSFEEWYANQFKYQKVDGTPPGEELKKTTYSVEELGQRLGLKEATAYELVAKGHFEIVEALGKRRVTKASFERWYASQSDYRTVEDQKLDADIVASTYGLPEMARMLGVHRQTIYYIVANGDFELIKVGRYKRATKESFEKWYQNQTRYRLVAEDGQERR
jgi:excisionase family DNA binding protein